MSYRSTQVKKLKRKSHNLQALQMRSSLSKKILKSKKEYSTAGLQIFKHDSLHGTIAIWNSHNGATNKKSW